MVARDACDARDAAALLRGRRGTWRRRTAFCVPPPLCVAGVALMRLGQVWWRAWSRLARGDIDLRFALSHTILHTQLCHTPSSSLSHTIFHTPLCRQPPWFCVAGAALVTLGWVDNVYRLGMEHCLRLGSWAALQSEHFQLPNAAKLNTGPTLIEVTGAEIAEVHGVFMFDRIYF